MARPLAIAFAVWTTTFALTLVRVDFVNDHFDRISRGQQIRLFGDRPFADFRDPGYFLTLYVSAAAQAATGGSLLGEALVTSAAIAAAAALTWWLAAIGSGSMLFALLAIVLTWLEPPRAYDYDKVLCYTAGLAAAWRYVEAPSRARVCAAACVTAAAALFRYDNGLYIFAACLGAIAIPPRRPGALRDAVLYSGSVMLALLPAALFVHATAGLPEAVRQIVEYARREGARSRLFDVPQLGFDRTSIVYAAIVGVTLVAAFELFVGRREPQRAVERGRLRSAVILCALVSVFVLRDPLAARVAAAVPVAAVVAAALVGRVRHVTALPGSAGVRLRPAHAAIAAAVLLAAAAAVAPEQSLRVLRAPLRVVQRLTTVTRTLRSSPPDATYLPDDGALAGMVDYLRACTPPDARVLVGWFAPEVFFFAERGFAGGMIVFFGAHWSSDADQQRTVEQLEAQAVPVAILQAATEEEFRQTYPRVSSYLEAHYVVGGTTSFDDPRASATGYRVLVRRDRSEAFPHPYWGLACPR